MSIVDITRSYRIFAAFLLTLSLSAAAENWQGVITQQLCQQWHTISGDQYDCNVSFPGLTATFELPTCHNAWQSSLLRPLQPGRNGLEITCDSPWWKQNLAVQLHAFTHVAVLAQPVGAGQQLTATDINFVRHDIGTISKEFFTDSAQVVGQQLRRNLKAGTILNADMLDNPVLITRGEQILIRSTHPGIQIEMKGTSLEQGRLQQRIRVRNDQSQKIITATVVERGVVQAQ